MTTDYPGAEGAVFTTPTLSLLRLLPQVLLPWTGPRDEPGYFYPYVIYLYVILSAAKNLD